MQTKVDKQVNLLDVQCWQERLAKSEEKSSTK